MQLIVYCKHSHLPRGKPNLLDMGSLLIKPVQRIMKYPLLLGELWHATPEDHPDYQPLQEAFTAAKIINVNINEFKRRKDIGEILFPAILYTVHGCFFHWCVPILLFILLYIITLILQYYYVWAQSNFIVIDLLRK